MSGRSCSRPPTDTPSLSHCPIEVCARTIRHRRDRMGLTLLLLRRAGEQLVKDVECPLLVGLPDDPRLLQEVRLCKGGKKNALRWGVTPAGARILSTLPVSSSQTSSYHPLLCSLPDSDSPVFSLELGLSTFLR